MSEAKPPEKTFTVGYIHNGTVHHGFMQSMMNFTVFDRSQRRAMCEITSVQGPYIYQNRNRVVEFFLNKTKTDYLLFIDNDISFKPDQPYQLLDYADAEHQIVAGIYYSWLLLPSEGYGLTALWFDTINPMKTTKSVTACPQPIGACGMGFTLLGRPLLEKMCEVHKADPARWFGHDLCECDHTKPSEHPHLDNDHDEPVRMGEDITFCVRARNLGYNAWGVHTVVDHNKMHTENFETFQKWNK